MYIIGQILISGGSSFVATISARVLTHLPGPSIGFRFSSLNPPRDVTTLCLATPRGLCRALRRPPDSGAGMDSGCSSLGLGFTTAGPIYLSGLLHSGGQPLVAVFRSVTEKPDIGRKYALLAVPTTPPYNVTLTLFGELYPRREGLN